MSNFLERIMMRYVHANGEEVRKKISKTHQKNMKQKKYHTIPLLYSDCVEDTMDGTLKLLYCTRN